VLPIQSGKQPAADQNGYLVHFKLVWKPAEDYNGYLARIKFKKGLNGYYYQQRAATSEQIIQQNRLQRA
jgi:hypothetical protein